ncbi:hypothetical protein TW85_13950 [Marinomonas sp. S3726]|uniref:hypothetical protein n=1 Tax=Marinomonas sp. S3726 TaxID=579484 RepID=UPI0005F9DFC0|nr:hypothetical protein [Marinomonas sp. S3726]KJZ13315.1 hypothetical protein TW85_13950 [Marinomonas sp. S3726]
MDYPFDCTQIVAVSRKNSLVSENDVCGALSKVWGGSVIKSDKIHAAKSEYVALYCKAPVELFEFQDKEFQGEFEDWNDIESVPERVTDFENCISMLLMYGYDVEKIFIIQTPSEDADRVCETSLDSLSKALYCMSLFYTGDGAGCETLIVNFDR